MGIKLAKKIIIIVRRIIYRSVLNYLSYVYDQRVELTTFLVASTKSKPWSNTSNLTTSHVYSVFYNYVFIALELHNNVI